MDQQFSYALHLSLLEGAVSGGISGSEAPVDTMIDRLPHQDFGYQNHLEAGSLNLSQQERNTGQAITPVPYQQRVNELQGESERGKIMAPMLNQSQDGYATGSWASVPMAPMPLQATLSSLYQTTSQPVSNQFPSGNSVDQSWQWEQTHSVRAATLIDAYAATGTSSNQTQRRNNRSFPHQQVFPYSLHTSRNHRRQSSQPNTGQHAMSSTTNHRRAMSTTELRYMCRVDGCTSGFTRARDEKRHYKSIHTDCNFICILCQSPFTRLDSLRRHLNNSSCRGNRGRRQR